MIRSGLSVSGYPGRAEIGPGTPHITSGDRHGDLMPSSADSCASRLLTWGWTVYSLRAIHEALSAAPVTGLEPATSASASRSISPGLALQLRASGRRCSIQLSYTGQVGSLGMPAQKAHAACC